jgi:hypothetical protein
MDLAQELMREAIARRLETAGDAGANDASLDRSRSGSGSIRSGNR